jgi:hypothetical protein
MGRAADGRGRGDRQEHGRREGRDHRWWEKEEEKEEEEEEEKKKGGGGGEAGGRVVSIHWQSGQYTLAEWSVYM